MKSKPLTHVTFMKLPDKDLRDLRVIALTGNAAFFQREIVDYLQKVLESERTVSRITLGSDSEFNIADLLDELRTPNLFGGHKLITIRNAETIVKGASDVLVRYLESPGGGATLVLQTEKLDGRTAFAKRCQTSPYSTLVQCERPYHTPPPWKTNSLPWDNDLARWTVTRANGMGISLSLEVAHHITQRTGPDLARIAYSLDVIQLSEPNPGERLTPAFIDDVIGASRTDGVFDLVEALCDRNISHALEIIDRFAAGGAADGRGGMITDLGVIAGIVLGGLRRRFDEVRRFTHFGPGIQDRDVAQLLSIRPFLVPRIRKTAKIYHGTNLQSIWDTLLASERILKRSQQPGRLVLEELTYRLAG